MGENSPPLPRGSYNFNFDDFDENTNPFETKTKVEQLDNDLPVDPFKPSKSLSLSPTTSNNNIHDTVNKELDLVKHATEPVKTGNKIPRSPVQSPNMSGDQQVMQVQDSSPAQPESLSQTQESPSPPEESPKPQSQKKPAIRKGIKKPKFKSKLKPPPNFGAQSDEIEIFAPPPVETEQPETTANENSPPKHDNTAESSAIENIKNTPVISHDKTADPFVEDEPHDVSHDMNVKNKSLLLESNDLGPEMARSLEMVHDFGANEMPYEENEGISPAPEGFSDSVGLDIAGDAQINSVYLAGNANVEQAPKSSGKDERKDEDLTQDGNEQTLMTTPTNKTTSRVPKHPATRVLEGEVEKLERTYGEEGEDLQYFDAYEFPPSISDSSRVKKNGLRDRMDNKETVVQLVQGDAGNQVLKYSQSDWNKMKQELELDFQTRLLNKEREWGKRLADKEKTTLHLREETKILKQSNDDMRAIVTEFEKTISQLQAETEKTSSDSQNSMEDIIKERDQAIDDLQGVEMAFSDLHRRYEKTKSVVEGFKKNEEVLKKCIEDYQSKLKKSEEKLQIIKQQAEEKLDIANIEMDKLRKSTSSDMARLEAAMRKADLQVVSLHNSLEQKVKENEELTAICDELISKVGSD
ncbi:transforming acidic coiled-coil-containing protein 2-like isoform X3 [Mytilus californianus]|uniref:transforming acidic coiled-coil-containing protein 2-like isoform X3 n=1 Tax=Mytilus californianus TaxID=6549 RepID=UPI0022486C90|nr:transforming acidic coiled-coil-containing protein 2-like isoform X3 [Mytilus californianus]